MSFSAVCVNHEPAAGEHVEQAPGGDFANHRAASVQDLDAYAIRALVHLEVQVHLLRREIFFPPRSRAVLGLEGRRWLVCLGRGTSRQPPALLGPERSSAAANSCWSVFRHE